MTMLMIAMTRMRVTVMVVRMMVMMMTAIAFLGANVPMEVETWRVLLSRRCLWNYILRIDPKAHQCTKVLQIKMTRKVYWDISLDSNTAAGFG